MGRILNGVADQDFVAMVSQAIAGLASAAEAGPIIVPGQDPPETDDKSFFTWMTFSSPDPRYTPVCVGIVAFTGPEKRLLKTALKLDVGIADLLTGFDPKWAAMRKELSERNTPGGVGEKGDILCPHCGHSNDADVVGIFAGIKVCQKEKCKKSFTLLRDMSVEAGRRYGKFKRHEAEKKKKKESNGEGKD